MRAVYANRTPQWYCQKLQSQHNYLKQTIALRVRITQRKQSLWGRYFLVCKNLGKRHISQQKCLFERAAHQGLGNHDLDDVVAKTTKEIKVAVSLKVATV